METQVPGEINTCEAVTYIDASHATCFRSRRYAGSFLIALYGETVYYNSKIQTILATISTELDFMDTVSVDKSEKYFSSILEDLELSRKGCKQLLRDNTAAIIIANHKKQTYRDIKIDVQNFPLQEWVEIKQLFLEHIIINLNLSDTSTKDLLWVLHNRHTETIMGEYGSTFMHIKYLQTMILWEAGG